MLGIVRGHRGAIKLHSKLGQGTTFQVLFPLYQGSPLETTADAPNGAWRGSGTVLVVDDEEHVRKVASRALDRAGFTVLAAAGGRAAIELFRERSADIDAVLLDLTMPEMNGDEVFHELRRTRDDVGVILSSGYDEEEVTSRFAGRGLAGFLQKPYRPITLVAKVGQVLKARGRVVGATPRNGVHAPSRATVGGD